MCSLCILNGWSLLLLISLSMNGYNTSVKSVAVLLQPSYPVPTSSAQRRSQWHVFFNHHCPNQLRLLKFIHTNSCG
ncbi:hypothetical protein EV361DRAFT_602491 [Lentinula raphanica]|nr:hypothetical protein EV361DRAFT_602491 [Lentinula raphanica]